ncbi:glycosyltransferase family 4 protein [Patescibacteria group bacterium]|nr:glycosyltransferase family 4 protein [Patescibacteria group bacterium]
MAKKINLFYVIADSSLTGAPRHLLSLVDYLDKKEFSISVILPQGPLADELTRRRINVFLVPMKSRSDISAVNAIKKLLVKYDPDILHVHGQRAGLIGRFAARNLPIKIVYTEHTRTSQFHLANSALDWAHIRAMRMLDKMTHVNIAVSQAVADFLVKNKITTPDKIEVIHNGISLTASKHIDQQALDLINQHGLKKQDVIIGTVGNLNIQKDTATLIKAMPRVINKLPKAKLVIVGSGPLKYRLQKLAQKLKISQNIIFTGAMKEVSSISQIFTAFVLTSRSEAFGICILEAMRSRVPVIATRVGGIPEIITNNHNGILVEAGDSKTIASSIIRLINDRKLQQKFIKAGEETVKNFSAHKMVRVTDKVYKNLLKKV